jgi:type I restriction-modification system DNA methylase subunit
MPTEDKLKSGMYLLYDCACGAGGMLTLADDTLADDTLTDDTLGKIAKARTGSKKGSWTLKKR